MVDQGWWNRFTSSLGIWGVLLLVPVSSPFPSLLFCLPLFFASIVSLPYWPIHLLLWGCFFFFYNSLWAVPLTQNQNVTSCILTKKPLLQKSHLYPDPLSCSWGTKKTNQKKKLFSYICSSLICLWFFSKVHVFRAVEPALKHRFKQFDCHAEGPPALYQRCMDRRLQSLATRQQLAKIIFKNQEKLAAGPAAAKFQTV